MSKKTIILSVAMAAGVVIVIAMVAIIKHWSEVQCQKNCIVHLKNALLFEMMMYADENDNRLPDSLLTLVDEERLVPSAPYWVCPRNRVNGPKNRADIVAGKCDYIYLGKGLKSTMPNPGKTVIIYEVEDNHDEKWIIVGFGDWHVEGVEARTISEAARKNGWIIPKAKQSTTEQDGPAPSGD